MLLNIIVYEEDVYDCSNMVADQYIIFNKLGIHTHIAISHEHHHTWIILPMNIQWETTGLIPYVPYTPDEVWCNMTELRYSDSFYYDEFKPVIMR